MEDTSPVAAFQKNKLSEVFSKRYFRPRSLGELEYLLGQVWLGGGEMEEVSLTRMPVDETKERLESYGPLGP